ncbi:MAG: hypothetical protein NZ585_14890 [Chloracidobacterium sp.]|nr:hypothetical protein [Chloracidobacterium sp.]
MECLQPKYKRCSQTLEEKNRDIISTFIALASLATAVYIVCINANLGNPAGLIACNVAQEAAIAGLIMGMTKDMRDASQNYSDCITDAIIACNPECGQR